MVLVRAALGHGVHQHAGEVALPHVGGREDHAEFLDRIERHDLAAGAASRHAAGGVQVEALALVGAVDRDGVEAVVGAVAAGPAARGVHHLRRQLELVDEIPAERGDAAHQRVGNLGGHALAGRRKVGRHGRRHRHRRQLHGLRGELHVHARRLGELDVHVVAHERLVADGAHRDRIWPAYLEALHQKEPVGARARRRREPRAAVHDLHVREREGLPLRVADLSRDGAGRDALGAGRAGGEKREQRRRR